MNDKPKMGYHVGQKLFDEYVCKIASALEVNEKWDTGTCTYPDGTVIEVEYYGKSLR